MASDNTFKNSRGPGLFSGEQEGDGWHPLNPVSLPVSSPEELALPMWIHQNHSLSHSGSTQCSPLTLGLDDRKDTPVSGRSEATPLGLGSMSSGASIGKASSSTRLSSRQSTPLEHGLAGLPGGFTSTPLDLGFQTIHEAAESIPADFNEFTEDTRTPADLGFATMTPQRTPLFPGYMRSAYPLPGNLGPHAAPIHMGLPFAAPPVCDPFAQLVQSVNAKRAADAARAEEASGDGHAELSDALRTGTPHDLGAFFGTRENTPLHPGWLGFAPPMHFPPPVHFPLPLPERGDTALVEASTVGSIGHPLSCNVACKYHHKSRGCKDGAKCSRCHLCMWTRACER